MEAYNEALTNDPVITAARFARDAAVQVEPKARALLLPQISTGYKQVYNDSQVNVKYPDPLTGNTLEYDRKNDGVDKNFTANLTQPLFNLESWYQLKQASEQAALAQLNYRLSEQSLLIRVAQAYFQVLGAEDRLRSATAEKDALQRQLDLSNQNLDVGLSSVTDVQDVQARYDLSVANELAADQALMTARLDLDQITRPPSQTLDPNVVRVVPLAGDAPPAPKLATLQPDAALPKLQPNTVTQWLEFANEGNLDLLASRLNFRIADRGVDVVKSRFLPTLSASADYNNSKTGGGAFPTTSYGPSVGVGVNWPLFSGGATRAELRQSVATREQRRAEYDGTLRQVDRDTRNAFQGVVNGAARVLALKQAVASSQSALTANETGLSIGTRSAIDVLNSQQQSYAAERDYQQSRYDYLISMLRLKLASGRLSVQDFSEIDALLTHR
jgi:outer membrane protein